MYPNIIPDDKLFRPSITAVSHGANYHGLAWGLVLSLGSKWECLWWAQKQGKVGALARAWQQSVWCGMGTINTGQRVRGRVWVAHSASNKSMGAMGVRTQGAEVRKRAWHRACKYGAQQRASQLLDCVNNCEIVAYLCTKVRVNV